jgi:hypothetical protein
LILNDFSTLVDFPSEKNCETNGDFVLTLSCTIKRDEQLLMPTTGVLSFLDRQTRKDTRIIHPVPRNGYKKIVSWAVQ